MIGKKLGQRYTIEIEISEGGMGTVYKAQHLYLKKPVALKILPLYSDEKMKKRFLNEAHKAMECKHDNVVGMYDYVEDNRSGAHFLVMEYVPGPDLKAFIESHHGKVPVKQIARIFKQICSGLQEIHRHHIVHRDLKPENIQIQKLDDGSFRAVILDFGIAKAPRDPNLTDADTRVGTYAYMSPEQIEGKPLDQRSDVYSLGVLLYYLLTGSPPFEESSTQGYIHAHLNKMPEPVRKLRKELPRAFQPVVEKALAKKPQERYVSAEALLRDFEEVIAPTGHPFYKTAAFWILAGLVVAGTAIGLAWRPLVTAAYQNLKRPAYQEMIAEADALLLEERYDDARDQYTEAINALQQNGVPEMLDSDIRQLLFNKRLAIQMKETQAESQALEQVRDLESLRDTLVIVMSRAAVQLDEGEYEAAWRNYVDAITLQFKEGRNIQLFQEADSLIKAEQYGEAIATYEQIIPQTEQEKSLLELIYRVVAKLEDR